MSSKKKILFLVTEDWYFLSHRLGIANFLKKKGYDIHVSCKDTGRGSEIVSNGFNFYNTKIKRKSLSITQFFRESYRTLEIIRKVSPDLIHLISLRPIVLGCFISIFKKNTNICITFTGLGYVFINKNLSGKILKWIIIKLLKNSLKNVNFKVITQNSDDKDYFLRNGIFLSNKLEVIRGSGIDLKHYKVYQEPRGKNITLAYTGRMLKDKGVHWLIEAFILAKKEYSNLKLILAGPMDNNNPTAFDNEEFRKILQIKDIHYLGNVNDIRLVLKNSNICVLFSKREGLPLGLMEAAAVGRPIISTDVPGSREVAVNNMNAITVPLGDVNKMKNAILKLSKNKKLRLKLSRNSRKLVESDMEKFKVYNRYFKTYQDLINN